MHDRANIARTHAIAVGRLPSAAFFQRVAQELQVLGHVSVERGHGKPAPFEVRLYKHPHS